MSQSSKLPGTVLEAALFLWNALNLVVCIGAMFTGSWRVYGSGFKVLLPLLILFPAAIILLWRLAKPTRTTLWFGALFWALQVLSVRFPDALYRYRIGLSVDFRLTNDPSCIVAINLLALLTTVLFAVAAKRHTAASVTQSAPA